MRPRPTPITLALLASAALALPPAQAQDLKPGLWEFTQTIGPGNGPTQKGLAEAMRQLEAALPADARKEQQEKAAREHLRITDTATTGQACLTPAQAAQRERLFQQSGHCTNRISPRVGATITFSYTCTDPHSSGEGRVTFDGNTGFIMDVRATSRSAPGERGAEMTGSMRTSARWLGAACGDVPAEPDEH